MPQNRFERTEHLLVPLISREETAEIIEPILDDPVQPALEGSFVLPREVLEVPNSHEIGLLKNVLALDLLSHGGAQLGPDEEQGPIPVEGEQGIVGGLIAISGTLQQAVRDLTHRVSKGEGRLPVSRRKPEKTLCGVLTDTAMNTRDSPSHPATVLRRRQAGAPNEQGAGTVQGTGSRTGAIPLLSLAGGEDPDVVDLRVVEPAVA